MMRRYTKGVNFENICFSLQDFLKITSVEVVYPSPLGDIMIKVSKKGISGLIFADEQPSARPIVREVYDEKIEVDGPELSVLAAQWLPQLDQYFRRERSIFELPLDLHGTEFQLSVWNELLNIPFGRTITYKELTLRLGDIKAIRAVAAANGANPVSIIVPCHRVIGSDGSLTGYAGGLWRKQWLLEFERGEQRLAL